ncbi:MAG: substrate-binding periplasmic protein [Pseudomonas sp.]
MRAVLAVLLGCWAGLSGAAELRWGFGPSDGMPYVEVHDHELQGGFTRLLGERVGQRLGLSVQFIETPNKRLEEFIQRGRIHLICNNNPEWVSQPQRYHWSPPLFEEEDVLLQHRERPPLTGLAALRGKVLGTSLGYVYTPPLMEAFAQGEITRQDVRDLDTRMQMLSKHRLDALIDMRRPLAFELAKHPELPLSFSPWVVQRYSLHCSYGPQLPVAAELLDEALQALHDQGVIAALLNSEQQRLNAQRN